MSLANFLNIVFQDKPAFIKETWIQGGVPRHLWMFAAISNYVKNQNPGSNFSILEVGTWMGSSLLTWAEGIAKYNSNKGMILCVDPMEPYFDISEQVNALQNNDPSHSAEQAATLKEMAELLKGDFVYDIWNHNHQLIPSEIPVTLLRESSTTALPKLRDESFHLVYLDGSHFYNEVSLDIKEAKRITKPGGIICGDDLELTIHQCDKEFAAANKHLDFPTDPKTGHPFHLGVTLAVGEAFEDVSLYDGFWMARKTASGFQPFYLDHYQKHTPSHFSGRVKSYYESYIEKYFQTEPGTPYNALTKTDSTGSNHE